MASSSAPNLRVFVATSHRTSLVVTCPLSFNVAQLLGARGSRCGALLRRRRGASVLR